VLYRTVVTRLEAALRRELPGAKAHQWLAPRPQRQWPQGFNPARIRVAAGLLLVFPRADTQVGPDEARAGRSDTEIGSNEARGGLSDTEVGSHGARGGVSDTGSSTAAVVLTVRADTLRHGGQVSLPGGVVEPGESFEQAARRETHEEIALPPGTGRVLGALTPIDIPVSGFRLHPIVAAADARPPMHPSDAEVARILEVGIDELGDPANFLTHQRVRDGRALSVPGFHVQGHEVWGATAMVLAEFLVLLGWAPTLDA
jgi:8-oxo-dGTP pyrophosphatase MutT (NUDIX family)